MSSRQRKRVYMHSEIFTPGIAPSPQPVSVYSQAQQHRVHQQIQSVVGVQKEAVRVLLPSPMEMKLTETLGHDVIKESGGHQPVRSANIYGEAPDSTTERFAGRPLVKAAQDNAGIPREFWATSSKLQWTDTRAELCARRKDQPEVAPAERKLQDMSSEVMGANRLLAPSSQTPQTEIRATALDNPFATDSRFYRKAKGGEEQATSSAAERMHQNLASTAGAVSGNAAAKEPDSTRGVSSSQKITKGDAPSNSEREADLRRRTERNFSDLFSRPATQQSPRQHSPRKTATAALEKDFASSVIQGAEDKNQRSLQQPRGFGARPAESGVIGDNSARACWDTLASGGWSSSSELCRRRRQGNKEEQAPMSARERKWANMSSSSMRAGMGVAESVGGVESSQGDTARSRRGMPRSASADCGGIRGSSAAAPSPGSPPLSSRQRYQASMHTNLFG